MNLSQQQYCCVLGFAWPKGNQGHTSVTTVYKLTLLDAFDTQ